MKLIIVIISFALTCSTKSQWVFETLIPWDSSYTLSAPSFRAISIVDSSVTWVVGEYDETWTNQMYICKRDSRGWREIKHHDLDTSYWNLNCVAAIDTTNAWVGNTKGKLLRTTNGGYNWIVQATIGQRAYINGIVFSKESPNIGYIMADGPNFSGIYILKTTNRGSIWTEQFLSVPGYVGAYKSISVIDSTKAWFGLVRENSGLLPKLVRTTNGGVNWDIITIVQNTNGPGNIQFASDGLNGVCDIFDNPLNITRTTNGGLSWFINHYINESIWCTRWISQSSVIYFQGLGQIQKSANNGATLTQMTLPFIPGLENQIDLFDAVKLNSNTIYGLAVTNSSKVIRLIDSLVVIGINPQNTELPDKFELYQNYPNPFNPVTVIEFSIPITSNIRISIYDMTGSKIEDLIDARYSAGSYNVEWNGSNFASGIYFYEIEINNTQKISRKMVLLK